MAGKALRKKELKKASKYLDLCSNARLTDCFCRRTRPRGAKLVSLLWSRKILEVCAVSQLISKTVITPPCRARGGYPTTRVRTRNFDVGSNALSRTQDRVGGYQQEEGRICERTPRTPETRLQSQKARWTGDDQGRSNTPKTKSLQEEWST